MGVEFVELGEEQKEYNKSHFITLTPPRGSEDPTKAKCSCGWEGASYLGPFHANLLGTKHIVDVTLVGTRKSDTP